MYTNKIIERIKALNFDGCYNARKKLFLNKEFVAFEKNNQKSMGLNNEIKNFKHCVRAFTKQEKKIVNKR